VEVHPLVADAPMRPGHQHLGAAGFDCGILAQGTSRVTLQDTLIPPRSALATAPTQISAA
jgi:hypothetical protein